ncbi:MAG: ParA family protein [Leptospirales bacterium]|nr:ParA family protein [Leptospirales bacterium]
MKSICVYNNKGGTGKTFLSYALSQFLWKAGRRVVVIDLDPQQSCADMICRITGVDETTSARRQSNNLYEAIKRRVRIEDLTSDIAPGLSIVAGHEDLADVAAKTPIMLLPDLVSRLADRFDYAIFDNNPNFSIFVQSAMIASELILLPTLMSVDDLQKTQWSYEAARQNNPDADIRVILNQFKGDADTIHKRRLADHFAPTFNGAIAATSIPSSAVIGRYLDTGERITRAQEKRALLETLSRLVAEIIKEQIVVEEF